MRCIRMSLAAAVVVAVVPSLPTAASAHVAHTVEPGETLWSIAAASNLTTRTVAAYNGLPEDAAVTAGSVIDIPSIAEGQAALAGTAAPADAGATSAPATSAPPTQGAYAVAPGDTLTGLAAQVGLPAEQVAYMNGLAADAQLVAGTVLKLPAGAQAPAGAAQTPPAARVVPDAAPSPAPGRLSGDQVSSLATEHGAPGPLAAAIGWQESGFNNAMVSSANARGIMQVLPGTWDWVQQNLAGDRTLDPASPEDNVRAGALYLQRLLNDSGGDPALAAAGYYQGPASVRRIGMLPETRRYVDNVLALRARFGG